VKNFVLEIFDDEFERVTYYTVRWDGAEENETIIMDEITRRITYFDGSENDILL